MCSMNMGTMNFALYPAADRYKTWKHAWEEPYLRDSDDNIFRNTFRDIEKIYRQLGEGQGTKFEHECYDVGHLYNLAHCLDRGLFKPPVFLQLIFGILGGIGPDLDNLMFMKKTPISCSAISTSGRARRRPTSDEFLHASDDAWRQCAGRSGGFALHRPRQARGQQRRAGREDSTDYRRAWI
jgi:uncharacterized protein (DUF849 family)